MMECMSEAAYIGIVLPDGCRSLDPSVRDALGLREGAAVKVTGREPVEPDAHAPVQNQDDPLLEIIGKFRGDPPDAAANHKHTLYDVAK